MRKEKRSRDFQEKLLKLELGFEENKQSYVERGGSLLSVIVQVGGETVQ